MDQTFDNSKQRDTLLALLHASRDSFLFSFAGMTEEKSQVRPQEGCWSALDCVEHICNAEGTMLRLLTGPRRPRTDGAPNREERFLVGAADRSRKLESPEGGRPRGHYATMAEATRQFAAIRQNVIAFVEYNHDDLRATEVTHPHQLVGDVSAYELVIMIARHAERHAAQIEEIKNSPAFQASTVTRSQQEKDLCQT